MLVNSLSLVGVPLYMSGLVSDLLMPISWMVFVDLFALMAHLFLPLLNRYGLFLTSRLVFLALTNGVIFVAAAAEGPASGMQYQALGHGRDGQWRRT